MIKDISSSAAALIDGGWKPEDKQQLIKEYDLTAEEAEQLADEMRRMIENKIEKKYRIKEEYWHLWGSGVGIYDSPVVDLDEIKRLAKEWDADIDELMKQVEEVEE